MAAPADVDFRLRAVDCMLQSGEPDAGTCDCAQQQITVRSALGAPRSTLVRQALTESVVLAMMGGLVGIAIAFAGTRMILRLALPMTTCRSKLRLRFQSWHLLLRFRS